MFHLLAVGDPGALAGEPPPSFEILHAATAAEAVEKLARNRRIDAILFFDSALLAETVSLLAEDSASAPPMFFAGAGPAPAEVMAISGDDPLPRIEALLDGEE